MAKIFDKKNAALMSFGKVMSRMAAQPLDESEIWYNLADLEEYAASGETAYAGMKVTYVDEANNKVYQYSIQTDGTLKEIGVAPTGDETSITVSAEGLVAMFGYSSAETGTVPVKDAETGKLIWKTLEEIGAGDGNDNTTYEITALTKGEEGAEEIYGIKIQAYFNGQAQGDAVSIAFDVYTKSEVDAAIKVLADKIGVEATEDTDATGLYELIANEVTRATTAEGALSDRIGVKAEDETAATGVYAYVDGVIQTLVEGVDPDKIDSLNELIAWVEGHPDVVSGLETDIKANTDAIVILNGDASTEGSVDKKVADAIAAQDFSSYATKQEITDAGYAVATEVDNTYAKKVDTYSKAEVDDLINNINEGNQESAGAVSTKLETYISSNDKEVAALKEKDTAHDTAIAAAQTQADKGVTDAAAAMSAVNNLTSGQVATNKTNIENLTTNFNNLVTADDTGLVAKVAALETADTNMGAKITALEAKDTTIEQTLGEHTTKIGALESKDNDLAALIQGNTDKFTNYYTKTEADAAVKAVTGEVAADTTLVAMIGAKADQATTYTKTEVDNLLANLDQTEINNAIKANADAIAVLVGDAEGDDAKSVRTIAKEEVAAIVNGAPEAMDTLKEVADWIANDESGAAAMANDIAALKATVDTGDQKVSEYVAAQIATIPTYELPAATAEILGGIKSAADVDGETTVNAVYVDATSAVGSVKAISTDILVQGATELILNGGNSKVTTA